MAEPTNPRPLDDESLRQAYAEAYAGASGPHLSDDEWERLTCGELEAEAAARAHAHITACSRCAELHRSLSSLAEGAATFDPGAIRPAGAPARPGSRTWFYLGGLAAAAAIFAAVSLDLGEPRPSPAADVLRTQAAETVIVAVTPATNGLLVDRRIAWQPLTAADAYELRINSADGGLIWTARVTTNDARVPAEISFDRGQYYWQVTALRDNAAIGKSPLVAFRVE